MQEVLSQTYGRPGSPGLVEVHYLSGLRRDQKVEMGVGEPGKGGSGGPPASAADGNDDAEFVDRGGAGGGRENIPIIESLKAYAEAQQGTEYEPIFFLQPGAYVIEWPYDTPTATSSQLALAAETEWAAHYEERLAKMAFPVRSFFSLPTFLCNAQENDFMALDQRLGE